jgi:Lipocalin-like domain
MTMSMIDARYEAPMRFSVGDVTTLSSADSLREQLLGTWRLVSYVERDVETGEVNHPMGDHPLGFIMYSPDGFVSAQLSTADRSPFEANDPYCGTPWEYTQAANRYIAYCGPFHVDELTGSLTHEMQISLFPNWLGQRQARLVQIEGDMLRLATSTPMSFGGARKTAVLVWRRARPNF